MAAFLFELFFFKTTSDTGDGIQHFLMAKYAFRHPELYLDLWGKPVFTLLATPFAQFGLKGMYFFNFLCFAITSFLLFRMLEHYAYSWLLPLIIFFSPIYFNVLNSGLTEILFSLFMVLGIYLFYEEKFIPAAIVFSFSPFVRAEGYFIIPAIIIYLLFLRKYSVIFFLGTGTVILSIIGYFYFGDIFWIIHQNYTIGQNYNYKGEFWHYFKKYDEIWGSISTILFIGGISYDLYLWKTKKFSQQPHPFLRIKFFLIYPFILIIFTLHILMNWLPGINCNLGMLRYMATFIPLSGILSVQGMEWMKFIRFKENYKFVLSFFLIPLMLFQTYNSELYPFRKDHDQEVIHYAENYIKNLIHENKIVSWLHPYISYKFDLDPFDVNKSVLIWTLDTARIKHLPDNSLILWETHYSPVEGKLPLKNLLSCKSIKPLIQFKYSDSTYPFDLWIFIKKNKDDTTQLNTTKMVMVYNSEFSLNELPYDSLYFNFDHPVFPVNQTSSEYFLSANKSLKFTKENEWGHVFSFENIKNKKIIAVEAEYYVFSTDSLANTLFVVDLESKKNGKKTFWEGFEISKNIVSKDGSWKLFKSYKILPDDLNFQENKIQFYFWNRSLKEFYVENLKIKLYYLNEL
ncbi:MAG: hypothetical protein N3F09_01230 [Bacteroidia bacterium]|nr:hypothetical protein [Bacteroidia bacterium]